MQNDNLKNEENNDSVSRAPASNEYVEVGQIISPNGIVSSANTESNNVIQSDTIGYPQSAELAPQPTEPKKNNIINKILWVVVLLCVVPILLILVSLIILTALAKTGASGTELMALGLIPVALLLPIIIPIGMICAVILLFRDNKFLHRIILIVIIFAFIVSLVPSAKLLLSNNKFDEKLSSGATVALIKDCKIESIVKSEPNEVNLRYVDDGYGKPTGRPHYADSDSYAKYVSAAKEMDDKCGDLKITYQNHLEGQNDDPTWQGDRWVTKDEAIKSILLCKVNVILTHIRPFGSVQDEPVQGTKTNIALRESSDTGMAGDIYVYSAAESVSTNEEISSAVDTVSEKCGFQPYTNLVDKDNIKNLKPQ